MVVDAVSLVRPEVNAVSMVRNHSNAVCPCKRPNQCCVNSSPVSLVTTTTMLCRW